MKWQAAVKSIDNKYFPSSFAKVGAVYDVKNVKREGTQFDFYAGGDWWTTDKNNYHLGGGEWDLYEVPETKEEYVKMQETCGIKEGDRVKIIRKVKNHTGGWNNSWNSNMKTVGHIGIVNKLEGCLGIKLDNDNCSYPYFCFEKVEQAKKEKTCKTCSYYTESDKPRYVMQCLNHIDCDGHGYYGLIEGRCSSHTEKPVDLKSLYQKTISKPEKKEPKMKKIKKAFKLYRLIAITGFTAGWLVPAVKQVNPYVVMHMTSRFEHLNEYPDAASWAVVLVPAVVVSTIGWFGRKQIAKAWNAV